MSAVERPRVVVQLGPIPLVGGDIARVDRATVEQVLAVLEDRGVDAIILDGAYGPGRSESGQQQAAVHPLIGASLLLGLTQRLTVVPVVHALFAEPILVARRLATLDHITHGRVAWAPQIEPEERSLGAVGRVDADRAALRREAVEVISAIRGLWATWRPGALLDDRTSGRYIDRDLVRPLDFRGEFFTIAGPLVTPGPRGGRLVTYGPVAAADHGRSDELEPDIEIAEPGEVATHGAALVRLPADATGEERASVIRDAQRSGHGVLVHSIWDPRSIAALLDAFADLDPRALAHGASVRQPEDDKEARA